MKPPRVLFFTAVVLFALAGCAKKSPEQLPPPPLGTSGSETRDNKEADARRTIQDEFLAGVSADRIFFDTDRHNIDSEDQSVLQSQAQWLRAYPSVHIVIEGHCDERGTRNYNIALGERRAAAAASYLINLGIDSARITTISYGKERPTALGSDEAAWAQNRRAVTVTVQR